MNNSKSPIHPQIIIEESNGHEYKIPYHGLTKREYFAAMALQGLVASPHLVKDIEYHAVRIADNLLNELQKK